MIDAQAISTLTALSPLDGRYRSKVTPLRPLLSEGGILDRLRREGFTVETPADIRAAEEAEAEAATDPES